MFIDFQGEESTSSNQELQLRLTKSETALSKKSRELREATSKVIALERKCSRLEEENHLLRRSHEVKARENMFIVSPAFKKIGKFNFNIFVFTAHRTCSEGKECNA